MVRLILIIFLLLIPNTLFGLEIAGTPKIIDGDTLHINGHKIRFEGIDAPEIKQQCKKDYLKVSSIIGFTLRKNYYCGITSKKKLEKKN